ncbi:hypothetical protein NLJ89_g2618 [Agrocybe chaxingu]|uniref:non-specific serine/threonine protein kinase n=1 Tax=Agrocybe chaxingu TaxID=84603 RepID=A0A9W8K6Y8_9AGAR|nr:hypothetical protein NLJ89_g2618 [Agrocybe chaxingu]
MMANQQVYQQYAQNKGSLIPGGFAHVYLVRTPAPVYNTTHHVLKRIAVASESMLTEVKKEVDIMRLLKGHPNIVHLIDAAWHKLPNGTFEVFILMEYCPGGGIIDMMNRRLRERLTEAEILQIFVDVCEGVAYMHNSRPPLLHRDLKVENILQSSATSFKLCDFGSATTVSNPPTNMQEIRALEADLNRHTTLQYRAPEMIDVYSKRPVNEKSDVWALGVLLYKLCYYTTPFEEHGPLAILNVQYRTPPYPVYSQDMNILIGSMLREHGAQRPSVFELLAHVHRLRGTKSKFTYNVPVTPPLAPRTQQIRPPNPLDGLVTYGVPSSKPAIVPSGSNAASVNQGIQARDKVLEAIAPMRRGRPTTHSREPSSRPPSPPKSQQTSHVGATKGWADSGFGQDQDQVWQAVTEKATTSAKSSNVDDAWSIAESGSSRQATAEKTRTGFGDDFSEKLWSASDPNSALPPRLSPRPTQNPSTLKPNDTPVTPLAFTGSRLIRPKADRLAQNREKDAFEGLGLMASTIKPAPTLGEARKLRTGLATMSSPIPSDYVPRSGEKANGITPRPTPSPRPTYLSTTPAQPKSISPVPTPGINASSWKPPQSSGPSPSSANAEGLPTESRFPSLEELDARFLPSSFYPSSVNDASSKYSPQSSRQPDTRSQFSKSSIASSGTGGNLLKPNIISNVTYSTEGVRSEQVTGVAMREPKGARKAEDNVVDSKLIASPAGSSASATQQNSLAPASREPSLKPKAMLVRKHRSSVAMKSTSGNHRMDEMGVEASNHNPVPPKLPPRSGAHSMPQDWLTGEDHEEMRVHLPSDVPVLRDSPSKRASFIEQKEVKIPSSSVVQQALPAERFVDESKTEEISPTVSKFVRNFPALEKLDTQQTHQSPSSGLTDNWSPVSTRKDKDLEPDLSSADEGPEEASSVRPPAQRQTPRRKGRQSSVHELVHQYGGGAGLSYRDKESERPFVPQGLGDYVPSHKSRPTGLAPPVKQESDRKTPSPTRMDFSSSFAPSRSPNRQQSSTAGVQRQPEAPPIVAKSPSSGSGRSRPQSMFVFPSKSTDAAPAVPSTNLVPPEETRPRAARRTSISDMVQRYEAIGSKVTPVTSLAPRPSSPLHRPVSAKGTSANLENGRPKIFPDAVKPANLAVSASSEASTRSAPGSSKSRTISKEPARQTTLNSHTTGMSRTATTLGKPPSSEKERPTFSTDSTPRPRRISVKAESSAASSSRPDIFSSRPTQSQSSQEADTPRPPRSPHKPTLSISNNPPPSKVEDPSPSPERPYQGVGRLIDQWQKKSVEAEQSRAGPPVKRTNIRKTSLVYGGDK